MPTAGAPPVDDVFGVIAHPVRRQLLEHLAEGEQRVSDLADPLPVSRSAVSQHLRLMLDLGLVVARPDGRERYYRLERKRLGEVEGWLERIDRFWADRLRPSARTWTPTHDRPPVIDGTRVIHEARYAHPPERVWRALTDQAELAAWLMPNDFVAEVGARFRLDARPAHPAPMECEVLEIDPPHRLRTQWIVRGQPTTVTFELRAEGTETVVRVEHDGLPIDEQPQFNGGWVGKLADIALVLDGTRDPADATTTGEGLVTHLGGDDS